MDIISINSTVLQPYNNCTPRVIGMVRELHLKLLESYTASLFQQRPAFPEHLFAEMRNNSIILNKQKPNQKQTSNSTIWLSQQMIKLYIAYMRIFISVSALKLFADTRTIDTREFCQATHFFSFTRGDDIRVHTCRCHHTHVKVRLVFISLLSLLRKAAIYLIMREN